MKSIEKKLNELFDLKTDSVSEYSIFASNDIITCLVVAPNGTTNDKQVRKVLSRNDLNETSNNWTIRFSTLATFDGSGKWFFVPNVIKESFVNKENLFEYLDENQANIYMQLLRGLSSEYKDLEEAYDELRENH